MYKWFYIINRFDFNKWNYIVFLSIGRCLFRKIVVGRKCIEIKLYLSKVICKLYIFSLYLRINNLKGGI